MDAEYVFRLILIVIAAIALVSIIMHYNKCIQRSPAPGGAYMGLVPASPSAVPAAGMEKYADFGPVNADALQSDKVNPIHIPARAQPPTQLSANEENIEELPALVSDVGSAVGGVGGAGSGYGGAIQSSDLLPKLTPEAQQFAQLYPCGQGDLSGMNFLESGTLIGQSTNLKRNSNLQLRSDPPIPYKNVSPWQMSTIRPDCYQRSFELGQA